MRRRLAALAVVVSALAGAADASANEPVSLFAPKGPPPGRYRMGMGLVIDRPNAEATLEIRVPIPQFTVDMRYGFILPCLSLVGRVNTLLINNEIEVGMQWAPEIFGDWLSITAQGGTIFGTLGVAGFDAGVVTGVLRPGLTLGHELGPVYASLKAEALITSPWVAATGDVTGTLSSEAFTGAIFSLVAEVPLKSGPAWFFGGALMLTRPVYQSWLLFPDRTDLLPYPRLILGHAFY
jgi:hypothetical protein